MIDSKAAHQINEQVGHEFAAFLQYVAISTWFDAEALPELSRYFAKQSEEERMHAMKMVQFLNDTDQVVQLSAIPEPINSFSEVKEAIQLAYDQEKRVTEQIKAICDTAADARDRLTLNFMQWFLEEQVEEVASMDTLLKIVDRAGGDLFRVEEYVAREGHPDDAAAGA